MSPERILICVVALTSLACDSGPGAQGAPDDRDAGPPSLDTPADADMGPGAGEPVAEAARAALKFKNGRRWARDLSASLDIPRDQLCRELGRFECFEEVYRITLGGVEPELLRIWEPLEGLSTAPIAVDRVALAACTQRVERDLSGPAVLFPELAVPGALERAEARELAARRVFDRLLRRDALEREVSRVSGLWESVRGESGAPERDWAILACFVAATMAENLHY